MDLFIREHFDKVDYHYYKAFDRQCLNDYDFINMKAIVCVLGHYIYINNNEYISYFNNDRDKVVAIWVITT